MPSTTKTEKRFRLLPSWQASIFGRTRFGAADIARGGPRHARAAVCSGPGRVPVPRAIRPRRKRFPPSASIRNLPNYAARSTLRMFLALISRPSSRWLWVRRGAQPQSRKSPDPAARHPAIGSRARVPLGNGHSLHRTVPRQPAWPRSRFNFRHFYRAGLEHDVLVLSVARTLPRSWKRWQDSIACHDGSALPGWNARVGDWTGLERDDELRRWLVLSQQQAKRSAF